MSTPYTYKNTYLSVEANFSAGGLTSNLIPFGGAQLRRIVIPSVWTPCNLTIQVSEDNTLNALTTLQNFDGTNSSDLTIPTVASKSIPLYAHWTDSIPYLQLTCSTNQVASTTVLLILYPLYQGIHG